MRIVNNTRSTMELGTTGSARALQVASSIADPRRRRADRPPSRKPGPSRGLGRRVVDWLRRVAGIFGPAPLNPFEVFVAKASVAGSTSEVRVALGDAARRLVGGRPKVTFGGEGAGASGALVVPMRFAGRVVGSLRVVPDRQRSWPKSLLRRLEALAALAAAAEWALSHEAARAASGSPEGDLARDPVTGLHVSAAFDAFLPQELALARAQGEPLSLMFLEFDPIASIRRRDGSEFADAALGIAARAVLGTLRPSDFVARCEGDRVAAVLPGSDKVDATRLAELVRRAVAEAGIASAVPAALTASIGLASRPDDGTDAPTLRSSAEFALARARELGGDRVAGGVDLSGSRSGSRLRPPRATG